MRAGRLRHRVLLQHATDAGDTYGEQDQTWYVDADPAILYAEVRALQGQERFRAQQVQPEVSHAVRIRYRDDVAPDDRLIVGSASPEIEGVMIADEPDDLTRLFGSKVLQIESVIDVNEQHKELQLLCRETVV